MIIFQKGREPGEWWGLQIHGNRTATIVCPECLETFTISGHWIHDDGRVVPSVVCTTPSCKFHEHIQLEGWVTSPASPSGPSENRKAGVDAPTKEPDKITNVTYPSGDCQ